MNNRYAAQTRLPEIGKKGQSKLENSRILIVGCGALGSPAAMYMAGAGIGQIIIADFDTVDFSNLHRQVFYTEGEAGKAKAKCLKQKMNALNSQVTVTSLEKLLNSKFLEECETRFDLVIDAADNPSSTYLLDEYCSRNGIPFITAGISGWEAQIFISMPGSTSYSEVFPLPGDSVDILPCSLAGITGPTAAFASALQCSEAIKVLVGAGDKSSRLITADLLNLKFNCVTVG